MRWWVDTSALAPEVHDRLARLWSRASPARDECADAPPDATFTLVPGDVEDVPTVGHRLAGRAERIPYGVSRALTQATLQRQRGSMLLLHAAGLTAPEDGRALVLVAGSGTGKSTAAHRLAGTWGYLSDESIGILTDHRVLGHPKPVSLLVDPAEPEYKVETSPDDAGYAVASPTPTLAAVVLLRRDPTRGEPPALATAPLLDGMLTAIAQTSSLYLLEHPLDRLARALTVHGGPFALDYRDIHDCEDLLAGLVTRDAGPAAPWVHLPPPADRRAAPPTRRRASDSPTPPIPTLLDSSVLRRGPWTDAVDVGDEALLLVGDRPLRLGGVGHALWLALDEPRPLGRLVADVVAALGEHPEARRLTVEAVESLAQEGLVEVVG